jgi:hypothetical protein
VDDLQRDVKSVHIKMGTGQDNDHDHEYKLQVLKRKIFGLDDEVSDKFRILRKEILVIYTRSCSIEISSSEFEDDCRMGCCAVYSRRNSPTFQRCLMPPLSGPSSS